MKISINNKPSFNCSEVWVDKEGFITVRCNYDFPLPKGLRYTDNGFCNQIVLPPGTNVVVQ